MRLSTCFLGALVLVYIELRLRQGWGEHCVPIYLEETFVSCFVLDGFLVFLVMSWVLIKALPGEIREGYIFNS